MVKAKTGRPEVKLGGKTYTLGPLSLNVMARLQEKWECSVKEALETLQEKLATEEAAATRFFVWCLLVDEYPDLTEEKVGALITVFTMGDAVQAMATVLSE